MTEAIQDLSKGTGVSLLVSDPCVGDVLERLTGYTTAGSDVSRIHTLLCSLRDIKKCLNVFPIMEGTEDAFPASTQEASHMNSAESRYELILGRTLPSPRSPISAIMSCFFNRTAMTTPAAEIIVTELRLKMKVQMYTSGGESFWTISRNTCRVTKEIV